MTLLRYSLIGVLLALGAAAGAPVPIAQNVRSLALPARGLVHDPAAGRIYASVPSQDIIASIDPVLGRVDRTLAVGSQPWQLALSDDGQYLYVGLDGESAVRRVHVPSWTAELRIPLGSHTDGRPYRAEDIEVLPGSSGSVAVSRATEALARSIAVFDDGVIRPDTVGSSTPSSAIDFDANPAELYNLVAGYSSPLLTTEGRLQKLSVGPSGVSVRASFTRLMDGADLKVAGGRAYSNSGRVADVEKGILLGTLPGRDTHRTYRAEVDTVNGRVCDFGVAGTAYALSVYDSETLLLLGAVQVGDAHSAWGLARWGSDGVALASGDKVFLVRTPLVAGPAADLVIRQKESLDPAISGQPLVYVLTVTNQGSAVAPDVTVKDTFGEAVLEGVTSSHGSYTVSGREVTVRLGALGPGARAVIRITVRPSRAGILLRNVAVVSTKGADELRPANNEAVASTLVDAVKVRNRIRLVDVPSRYASFGAKTLQYDPRAGLLYASIPGSARDGNSLVAIEPVSGTTGATVFVGSEPGRLILSDDGQSLYVALQGAGAIARFDLTSRSRDLWFTLGNDLVGGPNFASDLAVLPGAPGALAVSRSASDDYSHHRDVAVFDDGNLRNRTTAGLRDGSRIEAASASRLYGLTYGGRPGGIPDPIFSRMAVDATGVSVVESERLNVPHEVEAQFAGGRLYLSNGQVMDPETGRILGAFEGVRFGHMEIDLSLRKIFFLDSNTGQIRAFDIETFRQVGSIKVPDYLRAASMVRWGESGLALRGFDVVVLLDGPFVSSPNPPTNLAAAPAGATSVRLTWTDRSTNEAGFKIERKGIVNGFYIVVGTVGPNETTFTSTGLQPNSTYVYRVRAFGEGDYSLYSNEVKATTPINPPPAPNYLSAAGISRSEIQLTWRFGGGIVAGYKVEQSKDGGKSFIQIGVTAPDRTQFTVKPLTPWSTYLYRVRAHNAGGNGPYSNVASGTTLR